MKKIIYTRVDGGLSVVHPAEGARLASAVTLADGTEMISDAQPVDRFVRIWPIAGAVATWAETEAEFLERVKARSVPAGATNVQIIDESAIPADRTFRNAWRAVVGVVAHDMTAAKGVARDILRSERAERFKLLDGQWMRAMGRGEAIIAANIEAKRETLRNWPQDQRIGACATPGELKTTVQTMKAEVT